METLWTYQVGASICLAVLMVATILSAVLAARRQMRSENQPPQRQAADPFATLELQIRLEKLSRRLRVLSGADGGFASAHHHRATQSAYDDLLADACLRAGVDPTAPYLRSRAASDEDRLLRELELSSRGWTW